MNPQMLAEWVAQINALTGGGSVELRSSHNSRLMTIIVRWMQDGKTIGYSYSISMREMKAMHAAVQPLVLERITHVVRKMMSNAEGKATVADETANATERN